MFPERHQFGQSPHIAQHAVFCIDRNIALHVRVQGQDAEMYFVRPGAWTMPVSSAKGNNGRQHVAAIGRGIDGVFVGL